MLNKVVTRSGVLSGLVFATLFTGLGSYGCGSGSSPTLDFAPTSTAAASIPISVSASPLIPVPVVPPSATIAEIAPAGAGQVSISSPNTLANGDIVIISGTANYDGTYAAINPTPSRFNMAAPFVGPLVPSGTTPPAVQQQILATPATGIAPSTTPGQITLVANNTLSNGTPIIITGSSIESLNGPNTAIAPTPTSFSIATSFVPPPPSPAGTATPLPAGASATLPVGITLGVIQITGGVIPGCTTTSTGTTGAITLPSMATVPSRFSGVAPLAVFFDATVTTATATTRPFHDLEYRWNFGETAGPGIGTWSTGSRAGVSSRNAATGPVAAHVFETPGNYIVNLTVVDGTNTVSNSCVQIAVQDPDVVFAGANTTCFSTSGTFTGCSAGAQQITTSNFATAIASAATGKRLLLRRGETWTAPTPARLTAIGPGIVGAYGAGAAPIVQSTGNTSMLVISGPSTPSIGDWRVMDLEFDGLGGAGSNGVVGGGGANQLTFLRLRIHDASNGIQFSSSILDFLNGSGSPGHLIWDQVAIIDSNISRVIGGSGGNGMFLMARRLAVLGNTVNDTTAAEHVIRIQYASNGVVQANDLGLPNTNKHVLTVRGVEVGTGVTGSGTTERVVISENQFRGGVSALPVAIMPSAATTDERIRDVIFDGNLVKAGSGTQVGFISAADEISVRNNIMNMSGGAAYSCMLFNRRGAEPAHSEIRAYNNTCFSNDAGVGAPPPFPIVVRLDSTSTNVTLRNNLGYAPNAISAPVFLLNAGSTNVIGGSGTFGNSSDFQIKNTSPNFANASGTFLNASDFALSAPSYAINTGVSVPVFSDFFRGSRPQSGGIDAGATEQ